MHSRRILLVAFALGTCGLINVVSAYDSDGDGVDDHLDVCCATPEGRSVDEEGRPIGDLDGDCDVDLVDFGILQGNLTGELYPYTFCDTSNDCAIDEYCARLHTDCQREGTCSPRPSSCPDVWEPVCACDRVTYDSACHAALAGQSINYEGECQGVCQSNIHCDTGDYCAKDDGDCDGIGECEQLPGGCIPGGGSSVCGCDGVTYTDSCFAAWLGEVSIAHVGPCEP